TSLLAATVETSRSCVMPHRLYYAYVEATNISSYKVFTKLGYESLGTYHVPTFSRTFTRADCRVERLDFSDRGKMINLLNTFYQGHALTDFEASVMPHSYFVIHDHLGEVLAGAQCIPHHWYLEKLAGIDGWLSLHLAPWLPLLGRQINRDMHFVRFGNLYAKEGYENDLKCLMIHLLNMYQVHTGTIYLDHRSPIYQILKNNHLGIVNCLAGETPVEVMVHPEGVEETIRARIKHGPLHISIIDS